MTNRTSVTRLTVSGLLLALAMTSWLMPKADAFGRRTRCVPNCCVPYIPPSLGEAASGTVFRSGTDSEYLEVRVVGPDFGTLEIYLHSASQDRDEFARDVLPGAQNLQYGGSVVLAPPNPYGTFAVRYGYNQDTFKVYGWKKGATAPVSYPQKKSLADGAQGDPVTLVPGQPVQLEWVTPRILRASAGAKSLILRFSSADDPWGNPLYKTP